MNADQVNADELVELITWVLDRILKHQYEVARVSPDEILLGERLGPFKAANAGEIEGVIRSFAARAHIAHEEVEAFFVLRERRTHEELESSLKALFFSPGLASRAAQILDGADWGEILFFIDRQLSGLAKLESEEKLGEQIVKQREGFSTPEMRQVEILIENRSSDLLSLVAARKYAAEYKQGFPALVKRATAPEFRLLSASPQIPESVGRYLIEASRCYIYGHFLASLIVCRSAIEEAVKQRLIGMGELVKDKESLCTLLVRAKGKLLDNTRWDQANKIREKGRNAVHGHEIPTDADCIDALIKTRGILEYLFGRLQ